MATMPAWMGPQPLSYADQISRRQAWQASQGRGGQLGIDAMEDWAPISERLGSREFFGTGARGGQTTGRGTQGYFDPVVGAGAPDPNMARYNELINGIRSGTTPVTFGGTPMQPAGAGGGGGPYSGAPQITPGAASGISIPFPAPGSPQTPGTGNAYGPFTLPMPTGAPWISLGQITNGQTLPGSGRTLDPMNPGAGATPIGAGPIGAGAGGTPANAGYENFDFSKWRDPGYDFRLAEGQKLLQGSAAARGNLLSGATLKDLTNYGQGAASQEYANAFDRFSRDRDFARNRFVGDRTFDYLADVGDRDFAYRAAVGDRDYQTDADRYLASLGYGATGGTVDSNTRMELLRNALEQSRGNVGAAGTLGGSRAITNALQQAITQMLENRGG